MSGRATKPRMLTNAALLSLLALIAGAKSAKATSTLVTLHDVVFSDGGTASGTFSLNILGCLDPQRDIATTAGSVLGVTTYTSSGSENNSKPPADFVVFFSPGFQDGVQFQFLHRSDNNAFSTGEKDRRDIFCKENDFH